MRRNEKTPNYVRSWPSYNVNCKNFKEMILFYSIIGKKYIQLSMYDADREIPTLGSTDNAGSSVNSFPALSVYPRVGISLSESETYDRFYLSQMLIITLFYLNLCVVHMNVIMVDLDFIALCSNRCYRQNSLFAKFRCFTVIIFSTEMLVRFSSFRHTFYLPLNAYIAVATRILKLK